MFDQHGRAEDQVKYACRIIRAGFLGQPHRHSQTTHLLLLGSLYIYLKKKETVLDMLMRSGAGGLLRVIYKKKMDDSDRKYCYRTKPIIMGVLERKQFHFFLFLFSRKSMTSRYPFMGY